MIKIAKKTENPLLKRTFVEGTFETEDVTPSNSSFRKKISDDLKIPEENITMKRISSDYGTKSGSFSAVAYASKDDKSFYEVKTKYIREVEKKAAEEARKKFEEDAAAKATAKAAVESSESTESNASSGESAENKTESKE